MLRLLVLFAVSYLGAGQPLPETLKVQPGRLAAVTVDTGGKAFAYEVLGDLDCFREYTDAGTVRLRLIGYAEGEYWLVVAVAPDKGAPVIQKCKIVVGTPTPPVPPIPPIPPIPPDPPKPVSGLRVLFLYETADESKMPAPQQQVLFNQAMRTWLSTKCDTDTQTASGKAWRIADRDQDFSGLSPAWQKMMAAGKGLGMPAVVIAGSDGTPAYTGPLPGTIAEAQALVGKYAAKRKAG